MLQNVSKRVQLSDFNLWKKASCFLHTSKMSNVHSLLLVPEDTKTTSARLRRFVDSGFICESEEFAFRSVLSCQQPSSFFSLAKSSNNNGEEAEGKTINLVNPVFTAPL